MADLNLTATFQGSVAASTTKTLICIAAPAHQRVKIKSVEIMGAGTSNTDTPLELQMRFATADGTGTAGTFAAVDQDQTETPQSTYKTAYSAEPTYSGVIRTWYCHPQTGLAVFFPLGEEIVLKGGGFIGFVITTNQGETLALNVQIEE